MLPIVILRPVDGANGRNWPGLAIIDPEAPMRAAVAAQEIWEAEHKLNPFNLLRITASKRARRRMEIMGHEVEVQAASMVYGVRKHEYRVAEVDRMKRGYDGLFDGLSRIQLREAMEARAPEAARWVRRKRKEIERWKL